MQVLYLTYRLIIVTICALLFQNPEEVLDRTQNKPLNRLCCFLTSKCDHDLRGRDAGVAHDTLSYYSDCGKYLQNPLIYEHVMDRTQNIPCNRLG
jgi:hypothetical protein